ncbi:Nitrate reductase gamma subunit (NarI) (PDB:1Y5L) [Commensalibacter communis]|uniref:respiratory nitrate reductase subunit gamma n=1 Tax=Commensalibacter communis TaxID=2972786 RepID=UPI0022FF9D05|nr:respiratory nitrate reductase subunit gamma [Commensalibacter communis]CAI3936250.1 Nitrate reductase gamma subunit (NarI) (PDB:1Y5L) [Commensalibacter communis]CAI3939398.1 Nitrate reductase gamma subunit (NarI) (PDB:1Y5L) [Commensalibacter communis]CAI3939456.1 Nitrate reductase gamma subunit (NarI) (PDB:1Y5L) [Commensalibacter communis]CAI3940674.1 Nitrate reductase gamma subunit (NarI) (PDB:1Y5L) [Commensalibacter communis]CAI3940744.1 Nitrate reductase gamma subunit (NarI) (PDB:1Y5L) [
MDYLDKFIFGIYPYIVLTIFIVGCLVRFEREQYSWKSDSSQLLYRGQLRVGSILFHLGILGLFFGHLGGLLTPVIVWDTLGVSHSLKQLVAMTAGGIMGSMCFVGLVILIHRRFTVDRLTQNSTWRDKLLLLWLLVTLCLGLSTIFVSAQHLDGHEMVNLMTWAQHVVTVRGDAASYIMNASIIFKIHLFMGMTLFAIFPFTRLVHIFSGFGMVTYITRKWQLVRPRS